MKLLNRLSGMLLVAAVCLPFSLSAQTHYGKGDFLDPEIFVTDEHGESHTLTSLLGRDGASVNVLYLFGGGDMGAGMNGHLWCPDSFEDTHILRALYGKYQDQGVNFIPVAEAPVYHTNALGHEAGVFLQAAAQSPAFNEAEKAFIESTLASHESGILPVKPLFDVRFRLLWNHDGTMGAGEEYGVIHDWQGAFRAADETQFYGVPGFWVISNAGEILAEPMRGNVYHPHGTDFRIRYTLADVDAAIAAQLTDYPQ